MDAKLTKERLSRILSYDWLKIVGLAVVAIIVWSLIFTVSATRITTAQQFSVINYFGNAGTTNTTLYSHLSKGHQNGIFSYEVLEVSEVDVGGNEEMGSTLMQTRTATDEGDVIFVPMTINPNGEYTINGEKHTDTYVESLVRSYRWLLDDLDRNKSGSFFKRLEVFLNRYYEGGYLEGTLNEDMVARDFIARVEKNKDKRFKTDEQIQQGILKEVARVKKYRASLVEFDGYLDSGLVTMTPVKIINPETGNTLFEGVFSINICPNPEQMPNLTKITGYWETFEEGKPPKLSAANMNVAVTKYESIEESFEFESLLYINYVIRSGKAQ